MTVLTLPEPSRQQVTMPAAPFVVSGKVHGRTVDAAAYGLDDVLTRIGQWTAADPDATGHWGLHQDYSESLLIVARLRPGTAPASRRTAHLVELRPGVHYGGALVALCGATLAITEAESLGLGFGMPCERCVANAPVPGCQDAKVELTRSNDMLLTQG